MKRIIARSWCRWLSRCLCRCLIVPAVLTPGIAAQTAPESESTFRAGLADVRRLRDAGKADAALTALDTLLAAHEKRDYACARRVEVLQLHTDCAFRKKHGTVTPRDATIGTLLSYHAKSGKIRIRYTRDDLKKARTKVKRAGDDVARVGEFVLWDRFRWFTGQFTGPFRVTISSKTFPPSAPQFFVATNRRFESAADLQYELSDDGGSVMLHPKAPSGDLEEWRLPKPRSSRHELQIRVERTRISVHFNGRRVGRAAKEKGRYGAIGFAEFPFEHMTFEGKLDPTWMAANVDRVTAERRSAFDKKYKAKKVLPAWLFANPKKAVKGAKTGRAHRALWPGKPRDKHCDTLESVMHALTKGRVEKARRLANDVPDDESARDAFLFAQVLVRRHENDTAGALRDCEAVCERHPDFARGHTMLAMLLSEQGRRARAIEVLQAVIERHPQDESAYEGLGTLLLLDRRTAKAKEVIGRGLARCKKKADLEKLYGFVLKSQQGPRWSRMFEYASKHYRVRSDLDKKTCVEAARLLEAGYRAYSMTIKAVRSQKTRFDVYLFSTREGYLRYSKSVIGVSPAGSAGLYSPMLKQLLVWDLPDREAMYRTVKHEGFHQYLDLIVPNAPSWLNEGLAEYYETAEYRGGRFRSGERRSDHMTNLLSRVPLEKFLYLRPAAFYKDGLKSYAHAWALIHFLRHGPERYRPLFDSLFEALQKPGEAPNDAIKRVFGNVDSAKFATDLQAHIDRL